MPVSGESLITDMMGIMALLVFLMNSSGFFIPNLKRVRYHVLKVSDELKGDMRKIILNSTHDEAIRTTVLTALDEIEKREKEVKDREIDVLRAKLETESFKGLLKSNALELESILNANSLLTPRGVIEYVELHKISQSQYIKKNQQREQNWADYLNLDPDGQNLFQCITSIIKSKEWASTSGAAKQISSIFRVSCQAHHSTLVSILETNEIEITGISKVTQQYQLISCIASVFRLQLV